MQQLSWTLDWLLFLMTSTLKKAMCLTSSSIIHGKRLLYNEFEDDVTVSFVPQHDIIETK